jgi:hypothetical protein
MSKVVVDAEKIQALRVAIDKVLAPCTPMFEETLNRLDLRRAINDLGEMAPVKEREYYVGRITPQSLWTLYRIRGNRHTPSEGDPRVIWRGTDPKEGQRVAKEANDKEKAEAKEQQSVSLFSCASPGVVVNTVEPTEGTSGFIQIVTENGAKIQVPNNFTCVRKEYLAETEEKAEAWDRHVETPSPLVHVREDYLADLQRAASSEYIAHLEAVAGAAKAYNKACNSLYGNPYATKAALFEVTDKLVTYEDSQKQEAV